MYNEEKDWRMKNVPSQIFNLREGTIKENGTYDMLVPQKPLLKNIQIKFKGECCFFNILTIF